MSVVKPVEATVSCVFTIVINLSLPGPARLPNPEGRDGVVWLNSDWSNPFFHVRMAVCRQCSSTSLTLTGTTNFKLNLSRELPVGTRADSDLKRQENRQVFSRFFFLAWIWI